jgi:beta-glucosidase
MDATRSPDQRADLVLAQMTLDEKVAETHAISDATHAREVPGNARLCIPRLLLNNGPAGVGSGGVVQPQTTALPAPLSVAASSEPAIAQAYGGVEGRDTRAVGRNDMEGPNVNIARTPLNGRTFEAYGEDPYLAGQIASANVAGIQAQGVIATVKHFLADNQETDRDTVNELVDDRTIYEIYLPAFETAVKQGRAGSVMCSKNLINGSHGCEQQPPHQLAGFAKVTLAPGQTRHVVLHLTPRSFARWNTTTNGWDVPDGTYRLFVGTSSADLPLTASLRLSGAKVAP